MPCNDRQLTQAQLEAGFDQQRTGVQRSIRPFTGEPTAENLADYLNREVFPVLKAARDKVNEVFLQVKDNAPSANPLAFYFSASTANADPTAGFIRLNAATQDTATTIRVSESNARLISVLTFLELMSGSSTAPLGVVTIQDAINPNRFVRFDLNSMTDQGTYWDLAVTPVESSHDNPFVAGGSILISFIPGVAIATPAIPAVGINAVSLVTMPGSISQSITAFTQSTLSSGTVAVMQLLNPNISRANVAFAMSSNSLLAQATILVRASNNAFGGTDISFSNSNGISFGIGTTSNTNGVIPVITANFAGPRGVAGSAASTLTDGTLVFSNSNGMTYGLVGSTMTGSFSTLSFSNLNGVTFGTNASTLTASVRPEMGILSHVGGQVVSSVTRLAFSNASGVTFSLSTVAGAATLLGSVNDQSVAVLSHVGGQVVSSATRLAFSNASGVTFSLSTAAGAATLLGSVNDQSLGIVSHIGGNVVSSVTRLAFSNVSNVTWSLSTAAGAATVIASVAAGGGGGATFTAGTTNTNASLSFANNTGMVWGLNGATVTAQPYFLASLVGGNENEVTRLAFSNTNALVAGANSANTNNVVFEFSTNNSAGTIRATALMGMEAGTATSTFNPNHVSAFKFIGSNGVTFGEQTTSLAQGRLVLFTASVPQQIGVVSHVGVGPPTSSVTRMAFVNASNVTWSITTGANAVTIGASVAAGGGGGEATISHWNNFQGGGLPLVVFASSGASMPTDIHVFPLQNYGAWAFPGRITISTLGIAHQGSSVTATASNAASAFTYTYRGGLYTLANSTQLSLLNSFTMTFGLGSTNSSNRNSLQAGNRYITVHSSLWSQQPVLSEGVQYFMALQRSGNNATNGHFSILYGSHGIQADWRGIAGSGQTGTANRHGFPFVGVVSTTNIPATIGAATVVTGTAATGARGFQHRSGPALAFFGGLPLDGL